MSMNRVRGSIKRYARAGLRRAGYDVSRAVPLRYVSTAPDGSGAIASDPARLAELRHRYAAADPDVVARSHWSDEHVAQRTFVDELRFRAESMYVFQYVNETSTVKVQQAEYQYFFYLSYLASKDAQGLLDRIEEDGAFGAPMFTFPGRRPVSRDVLDSVNEILYLHRKLGILDQPELRVLDIGAGYGRLAHRMSQLVPGLVDYACIDGIPESTYVCERYLDFRGVRPPCRVIELPDAAEEIAPGRFDLAVNIHSFSEMPASAVRHWIAHLARARIPALLVIPNAPTTIWSWEADRTRIDMGPEFEAAGYELVDVEPIIDDPAVRELFGVEDHFHLFRWSP